VRLAVYDVRGRLVRTLHDGPAAAGEHVYTWDGADEGGLRLAPGVYFTRLGTGSEAFSRKVVLLP
jgi:flagellar hook assembly protein FlgD